MIVCPSILGLILLPDLAGSSRRRALLIRQFQKTDLLGTIHSLIDSSPDRFRRTRARAPAAANALLRYLQRHKTRRKALAAILPAASALSTSGNPASRPYRAIIRPFHHPAGNYITRAFSWRNQSISGSLASQLIRSRTHALVLVLRPPARIAPQATGRPPTTRTATALESMVSIRYCVLFTSAPRSIKVPEDRLAGVPFRRHSSAEVRARPCQINPASSPQRLSSVPRHGSHALTSASPAFRSSSSSAAGSSPLLAAAVLAAPSARCCSQNARHLPPGATAARAAASSPPPIPSPPLITRTPTPTFPFLNHDAAPPSPESAPPRHFALRLGRLHGGRTPGDRPASRSNHFALAASSPKSHPCPLRSSYSNPFLRLSAAPAPSISLRSG